MCARSRAKHIEQTSVRYLGYEHLAEDPTLADAILDRVLHNGYKLELQGESLRKKKRVLTREALEAA